MDHTVVNNRTDGPKFVSISEKLDAIIEKLNTQANKDQIQYENLIKYMAGLDQQLSWLGGMIVDLVKIIKETPDRPADVEESLKHAPPLPLPPEDAKDTTQPVDLDESLKKLDKELEQRTEAVTGMDWDELQKSYIPPFHNQEQPPILAVGSAEERPQPTPFPWQFISSTSPLLTWKKSSPSSNERHSSIPKYIVPVDTQAIQLRELLGNSANWQPKPDLYSQWMNIRPYRDASLHELKLDDILARIALEPK